MRLPTPPTYQVGFDAFFAAPGARQTMHCRVCGAVCAVQRDRHGPTSFVEAIGRKARPHDVFHCPNSGAPGHIHARELLAAAMSATAFDKANAALVPTTPMQPNTPAASNAERFMQAFRSIEDYVRRNVDESAQQKSFIKQVTALATSDILIHKHRVDLEQFARLRNAIAHQQRGDMVIAEPNAQAVADIERIAAELWNPPLVLPAFRANVFTLTPQEPVERALELLFQRKYSQVPIYADAEFVGLLTANTVIRWLGSRGPAASIALDEARVGDLLAYREESEHVLFLAAHAPQQLALNHFRAHVQHGQTLAAILITATGAEREQLEGIITVHDLAKIVI